MAKKLTNMLQLGVAALIAAAPIVAAETRLTTDERLSKLERHIEAASKAQLNLVQDLDELQHEIDQLRGISEEHSYKLGQVLERQRELYQEIETRLSAAIQKTQDSITPTTNIPSVLTDPTAINNPDMTITDNLSENEAYDRAVNMVLKDKLYDQAIPEFESFITQYPQSIYLPNAHYWLGQLLFNKSELDKSATHFEIVINKFPDSNKRCDAMLKLAMVAQKQKDKSIAASSYKAVIDQCPNTSAARIAKNRLSAL